MRKIEKLLELYMVFAQAVRIQLGRAVNGIIRFRIDYKHRLGIACKAASEIHFIELFTWSVRPYDFSQNNNAPTSDRQPHRANTEWKVKR